jgi:hypothetical protein
MKPNQKFIAGAIALLVVVGIVVATIAISSKPDPVSNQSGAVCPRNIVDGADVIEYDGVAGETALATLQSLCDVGLHPTFDGFVESIAGIEGGDTHFWAFYVNDEMSMVGAGDYEQQEGDEVKWVLTEIDLNF